MAINFNRSAYNKVFNDLDAYRDYCRFEGKVFDEKALYNSEDANWESYQKHLGWIRAKARRAAKKTNFRRN